LEAALQKNIGEKGRFSGWTGQSRKTVKLKRKYQRTELDGSKYLQPNELQALFSVIKSKRDRAIFRLCYHHGLRAHEPGLPSLADFRQRDGVLYIYRGKGSICREHTLIDEELKALRVYLRDERGTDLGPLFPSRQGGKGITRQRLDQLMKQYCAAAGIRPRLLTCTL
jgi:type 1 fimbriae regulatory protein FimB